MRLSTMFMPTRRDDPADAEVASHKLLVRGGYMRQVARGIYSYLPLGWRTLRKIEQIVREEMDRAGAQELLMPGVQPSELWEESGRWEAYGSELLRLKDRKGSEFCLGPTHEEVITSIVRDDISSYKQLPVNLYQIQTKFRDEPRPRFGLMRGREFIMKDAYSFDITDEAADVSYKKMYEAYSRIFERFGFEFRAVEADTGNIGGASSHEFQVLAETGEDKLVSCPNCEYAANVEKAEAHLALEERDEDVELLEMEYVKTKKKRTIAEVSEYLEIEPSELVKTLIYVIDGQTVVVLARGDHDINELKLRTVLAQAEIGEGGEPELASDALVSELTRAPVGFAGPVGLQGEDIEIVADDAVEAMSNFVVGANSNDTHRRNVNAGRDFEVTLYADLRQTQGGDRCGRCGEGVFEEYRGIEVGHIFKLGTKYSEAMEAKLQDQDGELCPLVMGCYGIGVTRIMAAVVEQCHDKDGIIWPMTIAPYHVTILPLQMKNEEVIAAGESIYAQLQEAGVEVILDDRDMRAGAKFKDADLVGIPLRIAIGSRGLEEGNVELKERGGDDIEHIALDDIAEVILERIAQG